MAQTLADLFKEAGIVGTDEEVTTEKTEVSTAKLHRGDTVKERPTEEVNLKSVSEESIEVAKTQKDPTEDLIFLPKALTRTEWLNLPTEMKPATGYFVTCTDTEECWVAPTKLCLNQNFVYREDLTITEFTSTEELWDMYVEFNKEYLPGIITRKTCYILDNPCNETYEVFYQTNYAALKYGQSTPQGTFIHKYPNRFHRDMAILEMDELYSNSSHKEAGKLTTKGFGSNEAIIISDGAWMKESCSASVVYLDKASVIKMTEGFLPTDSDQAVLIAEIKGATNALNLCVSKRKKKITYYYDNTSIVNVFKNRKTEYIDEITEYKDLLKKMNDDGYKVKFVELHPKTGEDRPNENKALMFFHNGCDDECRKMADIYKKNYKSFATDGSKEGKDADEVLKPPAKKPPKNKYSPYKGGYSGKR